MNTHRELPVWQDARALLGEVYTLTRTLPPDEKYVVVPQLRRAAWSVSNNIAEGNAKRGKRELRKFLDCSLGSLAEIDSMIGALPDVYDVDPQALRAIEDLRRKINRGIFAILRSNNRG